MSDEHVLVFADDSRIEALSAYTDSLEELVAVFTDASGGDGELLDRRPADDAWSVAEILHHLADRETAFSVDLRRILVEDRPALAPFDADAYADATMYAARPAADAIAVILATRNLNTRLLASLAPEQWTRTGQDPVEGEIDVADWVRIASDHLKAHVLQGRRAVIGML
ncbi:MAG TPA: DinB family protein [Candidatus Nanopelagicales bacterium]|nr:DinB family protein [Candidatus Nanopelagicales bacterium]